MEGNNATAMDAYIYIKNPCIFILMKTFAHQFALRFMSMEGDKAAAVVKRMTATQLGCYIYSPLYPY
jgi:hypothetical protein